MTFQEFKSFVLFSQPGTAVFHQLHKGWAIGDHLAAMILEALTGGRVDRPDIAQVTEADETSSNFSTTVEEYLRLAAEAAEREQED